MRLRNCGKAASLIWTLFLLRPGGAAFCQETEAEAPEAKIQRLEAEKESLQKRLQEIDREIQQIRGSLSDSSGQTTWELEVETIATEVLQASYEYATPVRIGARPWKIEPGQRIALIGAVDHSLRDFWQVTDGTRTGYIQDLLVKVYRSGQELSYSEKDEAVRVLAENTKAQLTKKLEGKDFIIFGVFPDGPDGAGGVGAKVIYRLLGSSKTAKYITFTVTPFNAVGDVVVDRISGEAQRRLKDTGPLDPRPIETEKYDEESFWDPIWYNPSIYCLRLDRVDIEYMDGTKKSLASNLGAAIYPEFKNSCSVR